MRIRLGAKVSDQRIGKSLLPDCWPKIWVDSLKTPVLGDIHDPVSIIVKKSNFSVV